MACNKTLVALLLLLSVMVMLGESRSSKRIKSCPQYCINVDYMTCESSGDRKLPPSCNCCHAPKRCTLHLSDDTWQICS